MAYNDESIYKVPWNSELWERTILERTDIARLGGDGDWVLYRPSRLIVRASAAADDRVRSALLRHKAERCQASVAEVAKALDMEVFTVRDDRLVDLVREIRSYIPCSASLDHVLLPGPNVIHGDDLPKPIEDPGDIPGTNAAAGEGVRVLVLDTGFDPTKRQKVAVESRSDDDEIVDEFPLDGLRDPAAGHGTHIAGIIARTAPGAQIISRRVLKTGVGQASDLEVAEALLSVEADVINCSFGSTALDDAPPIIIEEAISRLAAGTVVVAAAGNAGHSRVNWPAAFNGVVAVGAVGIPPDGSDWLQTDFSNHGLWVDVCAPGVDIASVFLDLPKEGFAGFATWSGTSMAAPAVSGAIAAIASRPGMDVAKAVAQLLAGQRIGDVGAFVDPKNL
jgi:subtilisin family serine protease